MKQCMKFVSFRSVNCTIVKEPQNHQDNLCKPCSDSLKVVTKASKQKSRSASIPPKAKAPLSACGPEKLRATVQATRLQNKQLEERLEILQAKIEKDGIGISASLETDVLKIMDGHNLEATPHMKFFWEQQMALMQSKKMGRRRDEDPVQSCL